MRCLWLTRQYPLPANSGELIYSLGLLTSLAQHGAQLTALCYAQENLPATAGDALFAAVQLGNMPARGLGSLMSPLPSDAYRLRGREFVRELELQLRDPSYAAVVIDQAALGWAVEELLDVKPARRPAIVYISHNCEAKVRTQIASHYCGNPLKRLVLRNDARKYGKLERRLCQVADLITAITPEDRARYAAEYNNTTVIQLLPGYQQPETSSNPHHIDASIPRRVLLVGSFEWIAKRHNLHQFLQAAAHVFRENRIELQIVGKASPAFAEQIKNRYSGVLFEPNVPSIDVFMNQARLGLVAETVGGGFKLKTLDYAFARLPIAALRSALGGVQLEPDQDALVEDSIVQLVKKIVLRIDDFDFLNAAAQRTFAKFDGQFDWNDRGAMLHQAISSVINNRTPGPALASE